MSINKRFVLFLSIAFALSVILLATTLYTVLQASPSINSSVDSTSDTIYSQFIAMGYTDDSWRLVRPDPHGNRASEVNLSFSNKGDLEKITCDTAYLNTRSAAEMYSDMTKSVAIMGKTLEPSQAEVMKAIEDIRAGASVHVGGDLEGGGWGVASNTYNDPQGGKLRYVCFSAWARYGTP